MDIRKLAVSSLIAAAGLGISGHLWAAGCTAAPALPSATATNSVTFGDGISYSLPILNIDYSSGPGHIDDCIVIATGSSGQPVNTNFAGMDNAYATPNGTTNSNPYFRTGDPTNSPDPGQVSAFAGDTATTWDIRLSALNTFLNGGQLVFMFNHNQTNAGSAIDQNLFIWAQLKLFNTQTGAAQYFYFTSAAPGGVPLVGLQNFGVPGGNPGAYTGPQTAPTCTYPTGTDGGCTFPTGGIGTGTMTSAAFMVAAQGQICLNGPKGTGTVVPCSDPSAVVTVNENLGADHVANAVIFPEIQALLASGLYDVLQIDLRMGCNAIMITGGVCPAGSVLNNGFEQIFITSTVAPNIPEPAPLALVSLGLVLLGFHLRRRQA